MCMLDPDERADQFAQNPDVASRLRAQLADSDRASSSRHSSCENFLAIKCPRKPRAM